MNSDQVFDAVERIGIERGNAQFEVLAHYMLKEPFRQVVQAALCPFTTYGVSKLPSWSRPPGKGVFDEKTFELLGRLRRRELTGNAALEAIKTETERLTEKSAALFERILKKDLRAGVGIKLVNSAVPGTIATFDCMLAQKYDEARIKEWPVAVEPKFDGVRALLIYKDNQAKFYSRTGKTFLALDDLADSIANALRISDLTAELIFDGEIMDRGGSFNKIVGDVHRKDVVLDQAVYHVFDIMPLDKFTASQGWLALYNRRKAASSVISGRLSHLVDEGMVKLVPQIMCENHDQVMAVYNDVRSQGGEGVIVKNPNGVYVRKRSYDWMKIKDCQSLDLPIVGFEEGTGKYARNLGAFVVDYEGVRVKVGSGLDDATRYQVWRSRNEFLGMLIEVQYHEKTPGPKPSLRHPRFVRFRTDKPSGEDQ